MSTNGVNCFQFRKSRGNSFRQHIPRVARHRTNPHEPASKAGPGALPFTASGRKSRSAKTAK